MPRPSWASQANDGGRLQRGGVFDEREMGEQFAAVRFPAADQRREAGVDLLDVIARPAIDREGESAVVAAGSPRKLVCQCPGEVLQFPHLIRRRLFAAGEENVSIRASSISLSSPEGKDNRMARRRQNMRRNSLN